MIREQSNNKIKTKNYVTNLFQRLILDINALYDSEFDDYSNIKFKEKYNKVVNLPIDDIIHILGVPNCRIEYDAIVGI